MIACGCEPQHAVRSPTQFFFGVGDQGLPGKWETWQKSKGLQAWDMDVALPRAPPLCARGVPRLMQCPAVWRGHSDLEPEGGFRSRHTIVLTYHWRLQFLVKRVLTPMVFFSELAWKSWCSGIPCLLLLWYCVSQFQHLKQKQFIKNRRLYV